ncbi:hypothetical protein BKA65DRAFT_476597 [Rhexocercosporidium sp. MPI-PUGE-AT-0058]|nr:hypothetical protein BKA65DRAFT_476597 [Rhexocercosporidium sp. MPI-PUGE-AT-0058]
MTPNSSSEEHTSEQNLRIFLAVFVLFSLVFKYIDELPYANVATIHLVAYSACNFTSFPLDVAADVLISNFVIITIFKLIFQVLGFSNFGGLAKWTFILAAAYSFVIGSQQSSSQGKSYWVDRWNDAMGTFNNYSVTFGIGLAGILISFFTEDGYNSSLFRKSAVLFATIRAGIEAYYDHVIAAH